MKNLNIIIIIFIAFAAFAACDNKDDKIILSAEELIVQNGPWNIDHLELINVLNTGNPDFNEPIFLAEMNTNLIADGDIVRLTFNQNGTGGVTYINRITNVIEEEMSWTWEITTTNQLKTQTEGHDPEIYNNVLVTETHLELIAFEDANLATNVTGDVKYICVPKSN